MPTVVQRRMHTLIADYVHGAAQVTITPAPG
jgi:hypothetical protein